MITCISNPPYNLRWQQPIFAQMQDRFKETEVPPESNANFAFILTALNRCDRASFILPQNVLSSNNKAENEIRKYLIEKNYIEAVILCPDKMFEATSIQTCIIVFNKNKETSKIVMIDASSFCEKEIREQKAQFGGKAHMNRIYKKEINIFTDKQIEEINNIVREKIEKKNFSRVVTIEDIKENNYSLFPGIYCDIGFEEKVTRSYEDVVNDLNRVVKQKNCLKLTINEKIAKSIGIYELANDMKNSEKLNNEINESLENIKDLKIKIEKENFISLSKNKNEIKFENNSKEQISEILLLIMNNWKMMIYHLNNEENRYLVELKDKLLDDLMSGKLKFE